MLSLQSFHSLAEFCTDGTKSLTDVPFADGYIEGQGFPCEHLNYFWNNFTKNGVLYQAGLTSIENEILNVLTQASISPSSGDNTQLYDAIDYQIKHTETSADLLTSGTLPDARFPATLPAVSGANLTNIATALGTTRKIVYRDSAGAESDVTVTTKKIEIGDWNMDSEAALAISVAHGVTNWRTIHVLGVYIRPDPGEGAEDYSFNFTRLNGDFVGCEVAYVTSSIIRLVQGTYTPFSNTYYDDTSYNRGWILIEYEE